MKLKNVELLFIIFLIIISIFLILEGISMPVISQYSIGPGFLPIFIGICIVVVSIILFILNITKNMNENQNTVFITKDGALNLGFFIGVLLITISFYKLLGLIIPLIAFMIIIFRFIEKYSWFTSIKVAVVCNIIFYLIFKIWLGVPLPGFIL